MEIKFSEGLSMKTPTRSISLETVTVEMSARQFLAFIDVVLRDEPGYKESLTPFQFDTLTEFAHAGHAAILKAGLRY